MALARSKELEVAREALQGHLQRAEDSPAQSVKASLSTFARQKTGPMPRSIVCAKKQKSFRPSSLR
ncbi:MAG: hypothetical protein HZT39_13600 [Pseudoxanthomonas sp.]|nr:MAG: hypothetical protein HZT39_13600 [Pseudoxanthomonas sp.]